MDTEVLFGGMLTVTIVILIVSLLIGLAFAAFLLYCQYRIYQKAGYEGWKALIPYYNSYIMSEFALGNGWYFLAMFIPMIGIAASCVLLYRMGKCFGKGVGFGLGLIFIPYVFFPILAFEKENTYRKLPPITELL